MSIRLSHSAQSKYQLCPNLYRLHYEERWRSIILSSALVFGSAMDEALNILLEKKDLNAALEAFNMHWEQGKDHHGQLVDIPLNPNMKYFKSDFDAKLLEKKDWAELFKYDGKFFETKEKIDELLKAKTEWIDIPEEMRMPYNYANWLCMQKKGEMMLKAYYTDILPEIAEVLAVQMPVELTDEDGNVLNGIVDLVARLKDGRVAVLDNKTSGSEYEEDSVAISDQLAKYFAILNIFAEDENHPWQHKIDLAGYCVMVKKIVTEETKTCTVCNHIGLGSHKTCDNVIDGKRCNGEWGKVKSHSVKTQFLTGNISEEFAEVVLENASTVKTCIEMGLFPKNFNSCQDQFGAPCAMIGLCHKKDSKGLIQKEKK